ncbi:MAG: thymidylate synthase [Candidatus Taylorbacteria bacterium RIFCSPHIGHO2_01_FULL_46_22b]|uniref:Thymidylate synthase n=1 Tax=Candidatus Taylorbacteria bacterium RIFCSPHIGHO2_01_FULL_46_22b TaxID=1802301 RepID=A0A1G2M6M0_9BACT|nr:MAG: thymidylate synthase [Candidatus Taylorbacteria bacterium RIFCSPHIGHO2_01_FULL_46_22b]
MSIHPEQQYLDLLKETVEKGDRQVDQGHGKATFGVFGRQIRFDLSKGFPLLTTKRVYWKGVRHELFWFMTGQSNIKYLVDNDVHIWDDYPHRMYQERAKKGEFPEMEKEIFIGKIKEDAEFAKKFGNLPRVYGDMWRHWPTKDGKGIDQLAWAIEELRNDPSCHNAIVTSWNPEYLYTMAKPEDANRFPICHNMYQFNIKNEKVSLQLYQRSADIFLGVPFNIASYALLCHIVAKILGREVGEFVHTFGDVHIYEDHFEPAKEQLKRKPKAFPTLSISSDLKSLNDFNLDQVKLEGYDPHDTIKAEFTVAGLRDANNKPAGK